MKVYVEQCESEGLIYCFSLVLSFYMNFLNSPPKSSKLKPKPKSEPAPPKPEPQPPISKPEPQEFVAATVKKNEDDGVETVPPTHTKPELDATVKMEEAEDEPESVRDDPIDEDIPEEDTVVREIDVFFSPSVDAQTQVRLSLSPLLVSMDSAFFLFIFKLIFFCYF